MTRRNVLFLVAGVSAVLVICWLVPGEAKDPKEFPFQTSLLDKSRVVFEKQGSLSRWVLDCRLEKEAVFATLQKDLKVLNAKWNSSDSVVVGRETFAISFGDTAVVKRDGLNAHRVNDDLLLTSDMPFAASTKTRVVVTRHEELSVPWSVRVTQFFFPP